MQLLFKFIPLLASKASYLIIASALGLFVFVNIYTYKSLKKENEALIRQTQQDALSLALKTHEIAELKAGQERLKRSYEAQISFTKAQAKELSSIKQKIRSYKDENISDGLRFVLSSINERLSKYPSNKDTSTSFRAPRSSTKRDKDTK